MTTETAPAAPQAVTGKEYQLLINGQQVAPKSGEMSLLRWIFVAWSGILTAASAARMVIG